MYLKYCQEDLGGELFSLGDLFPTEDCEGRFLNYVPNPDLEIGKYSITNYLNILKIFSKRLIDVTSDFGTVQNAIGQLLGGSSDQYWVNAQRSGSLYRYQGDSERPTFHTTTDNNGDCLTFSSDSGNLESAVRISCGLLLSIVIHLRAKTVRL